MSLLWIVFGTNISDKARHQMTVQFLTSPGVCCCITWEKKNQQNVAFLSKTVLLPNQNHAQKHI